ncbi:FUN14 family protein [Abortiporus biennis]
MSFANFMASLAHRQILPSSLRSPFSQAHRLYHNPFTPVNHVSLSASKHTVFKPLFARKALHVNPRNVSCTAFAGFTAAVVGLSLTASAFYPSSWIHCEPLPGTKPSSDGSQSGATPQQRRPGEPEPLPPTPASSVSLYELSFGTVCGICAGVFVKKGAKTLAFVFGGVFVLLQYLGSLTLVKVDWPRVGKKFENLFYTTDVQGVRRAPNVGSLFRWFVDFLTSDFQQRASFVAGFALGLRIG